MKVLEYCLGIAGLMSLGLCVGYVVWGGSEAPSATQADPVVTLPKADVSNLSATCLGSKECALLREALLESRETLERVKQQPGFVAREDSKSDLVVHDLSNQIARMHAIAQAEHHILHVAEAIEMYVQRHGAAPSTIDQALFQGSRHWLTFNGFRAWTLNDMSGAIQLNAQGAFVGILTLKNADLSITGIFHNDSQADVQWAIVEKSDDRLGSVALR